MKYQPFVPAVVQSLFDELLNGKAGKDIGLLGKISEIDRQVAYEQESQSEPQTNWWQIERDSCVRHIEHIKLLSSDTDMEEAYNFLSNELQNEEQWRGFFYSAFRADYDYQEDRESIERGKILTLEISEEAKILAEKISQLGALGIDNMPKQFFSVRHLLEICEGEESHLNRYASWQVMRPSILGTNFTSRKISPLFERTKSYSAVDELLLKGATEKHLTLMKNSDLLPTESTTQLDIIWSTAPSFPALLRTFSEMAGGYEPSQTGMIGAAIDSQKPNKKSRFIRGFGSLLKEEYKIPLNNNIIKAVAIVTTILLDDPEIVVTNDDVRKALKRVGLI